jgi:hypothetical protein
MEAKHQEAVDWESCERATAAAAQMLVRRR